MHCLWRAVDHDGEVLESHATKKRDKSAALRFIKKALKRHGQPEAVVTDGLRSYPQRCATSAIWIGVRWGAGSTIEPKIPIFHFGDESGPCCVADR